MNLTAPPPSNKRVAATRAAVIIHQFFLKILNSPWDISFHLFHLFSAFFELRLSVVVERTSIACGFAEFSRISSLPDVSTTGGDLPPQKSDRVYFHPIPIIRGTRPKTVGFPQRSLLMPATRARLLPWSGQVLSGFPGVRRDRRRGVGDRDQGRGAAWRGDRAC